MVRFFADTSNVEEIKKLLSMGIISGVTTNPKIIATDGGEPDFEKRIRQILAIAPKGQDFPLSVEVTCNDCAGMVEEGRKYAKWDKNIVVKIPMHEEGLSAVKTLSHEGIRTNVTAIMSVTQGILAAKAGATYVSFFYGRIGDMGEDPSKPIEDFVKLRAIEGSKTPEIIIGSIRSIADIRYSMLTGAEIITIPPKFFKSMAYHPQTEKTINDFLEAWKGFKKP